MSPKKPAVFRPGKITALELGNRIIRTAAFEGMCPGGLPSDDLIEHHREVARGGAAMTTVAYCSVSPDGRTYGHQMYMRPEIVPALRRLTDAVHREGAAVSIQLGHCGNFAAKKVIGSKPIAPSRVFNLYGLTFPRKMSEQDMDRVTEDFGKAALLAVEAGFDAVELHAGHGYLLSQFLSPHTNRRRDAFGGSLENRMRFPARVVEHVRQTVDSGFPVLVKTNLSDGFKSGMGLEEAVVFAKRLEDVGASALVLSGGFVSKTPLYMMRGDVPVKEMAAVQESVLRRVGLTLFGNVFVQTYPFRNLFFLEEARVVRAAVELPLVLLGGICSAVDMQRAVDEGFDFVALGRALIQDPQFVQKIEHGELEVSPCDHCNKCIAEMDRGGVRCVLDLPQTEASPD